MGAYRDGHVTIEASKLHGARIAAVVEKGGRLEGSACDLYHFAQAGVCVRDHGACSRAMLCTRP